MQTVSFNPNIPHLIYHLDYRVYSRPFRIPLHTHHGKWVERQGIVLKLSDQYGRVGFGEIAPLPWFGSETWEQALDWGRQNWFGASVEQRGAPSAFLTRNQLLAIPDDYPASQFGIESALECLERSPRVGLIPSPPYCYLLPTGDAVLTAWQQPWSEGFHTFKWKIGVAPLQEELALFEQWFQALPPTASIRLDANGGLSWDMACQWLEACDQWSGSTSHNAITHNAITYNATSHNAMTHNAMTYNAMTYNTNSNAQNVTATTNPATPTIEFLEQPLPADDFEALLALSHRYATPIALDESVATFSQLRHCYERGWRGIFVIKAAIAGSPRRLRHFCQRHDLDVVWSSALETAIARQFITRYLIPSLSTTPRPLGFGIEQWFEPSPLDQTHPAAIWDHCYPQTLDDLS